MVLAADIDRDRQADELEALTEVAKALVAPLDFPELLESVMHTIGRVLEPADLGAVMLWDQPSGLFRAAAGFGYDLPVLKEIGLRAGEAITGKVFDAGLPGCWQRPTTSPKPWPTCGRSIAGS